ncbi:MAG: amidase [Ignavibacteriae bacterium]|nr:amidase [Ignavibacteriota bacterium]
MKIALIVFSLAAVTTSVLAQPKLTKQMVAGAESLIGLQFNDAKRDSMLDDLTDQLSSYAALRAISIPNSIPPAILFNPIPSGATLPSKKVLFKTSPVGKVALPPRLDDVASYSIGQLAQLIRTRKITSLQLTKMYLDRLKHYGPTLECVITLTESLAVAQAARADKEIAAGKYRGPLHGIPYGAKDLLATKGIRTTWGSVPFKHQVIDEDATVIKRLENAGAVLVAKLTMGELAWGDVWFGGKTRNPWKLDQGSSGSSAGSAAATAAGLVAFSIGTETWGSIVSPSNRCGATGLRPTYGRVSRTGAMALSWSMDKIGPICRTVEDCAIVFNAICGPDGIDQTLYDVPFNYSPSINLKKLRVGYLKSDFDSLTAGKSQADATLATLRSMGVQLVPIDLPALPIEHLHIILGAEAAAAFDELTRSGKDSLLVRQIKNAWPNSFRASRFIPAVEYIQANRVRFMLIQQMAQLMKQVDLYVAPSVEGNNSLLTNLTGHPCVVVPNGFTEENTPTSITFIGNLFDEGTLLTFAKKYQDATGFHLKHPTLEK